MLEWYTVAQLSERWRVTPSALRRRILRLEHQTGRVWLVGRPLRVAVTLAPELATLLGYTDPTGLGALLSECRLLRTAVVALERRISELETAVL